MESSRPIFLLLLCLDGIKRKSSLPLPRERDAFFKPPPFSFECSNSHSYANHSFAAPTHFGLSSPFPACLPFPTLPSVLPGNNPRVDMSKNQNRNEKRDPPPPPNSRKGIYLHEEKKRTKLSSSNGFSKQKFVGYKGVWYRNEKKKNNQAYGNISDPSLYEPKKQTRGKEP